MIIILMGASCTGKDTIMKELTIKGYEPILSFTDRPIRDGEKDGVEYYFKSPKDFDHLVKKNKLIECRTFKTTNGLYRYGTPKFKIKKNRNYVCIKDPKGVRQLLEYFGKENCKVYYVFVPNKERERRCMLRGDYNKFEFARRLNADSIDFAYENIKDIPHKTLVNWKTDIKDIINEIIE